MQPWRPGGREPPLRSDHVGLEAWRPDTGITQGTTGGDPLLDQVAAPYTRHIAESETHGIRAALRGIEAWVLYSKAEQIVLMAEFKEPHDSMLKQPICARSAVRISGSVLPTPA